MQLQKMTTKEVERVLRNMEELQEENIQRLEIVSRNWDRCQKNGELISKEEAILCASMPGMTYGDKVSSSGDIYHDELLRTLQESRRLYMMGMNSVMNEHNRLMAEQDGYLILSSCIRQLPDDAEKIVSKYYMKNLTLTEGQDLFQLARSQFFKKSVEALELLTAEYNREVDDVNAGDPQKLEELRKAEKEYARKGMSRLSQTLSGQIVSDQKALEEAETKHAESA